MRELRETFEVFQMEYQNIGEMDVEKLKATKQDLESDRARIANIRGQLSFTGKLRSKSEQAMKLNE
jgi:hypothetical protein